MFIRLLLLFTLVPILELYVLLEAGRQIGVGATILMIFLTGIAGAYLARSQGFELLNRIQAELQQGRIPADDLSDGLLILGGGLLLLTPGFCTDFIGFIMLTPVTRRIVKVWLRKWFDRKISRQEIRFYRS